jgi:ATP-dependent exoDNAse (exonuclease V) alpha subunit
VELSPAQVAVVDQLRDHSHARVTGLAGAGKTTIALQLPELLGWRQEQVVYAAPTNRALRVLARKASGRKLRTKTVHQLLYGPPSEKHCLACPAHAHRECHGPSPWCVCGDLDTADSARRYLADSGAHIVVDEASMVRRGDYAEIMEQAGSVKSLVFIGDPGQLPPVDPEDPNFQMLEIDDDRLPIHALAGIHRQAEGSEIIRLAHAVRHAPAGATGPALLPDRRFSAEVRIVPASHGPWWQAMAIRAGVGPDGRPRLGHCSVLAYSNRSRVQACLEARRAIYGDLALSYPVLPGEIVRARLRYSDKVLVNEEMGRVVNIDPEASNAAWTTADVMDEEGRVLRGQRLVHAELAGASIYGGHDKEFLELLPDKEVRKAKKEPRWLYGYGLTVHASQGGEFRSVIYHLGPGSTREEVYTAVTRARELCVVVLPW